MDFILDDKLNPWLIEVNLSPACAERTEWLTEMLDNFTDGLLDILEGKLLKLTDDFDADLLSNMKQGMPKHSTGKQKWELIYD
jgi:hypothetical protein